MLAHSLINNSDSCAITSVHMCHLNNTHSHRHVDLSGMWGESRMRVKNVDTNSV